MEDKWRFDDCVTLIGGGPCESVDIERAVSAAPRVVAADGGADRAAADGIVPDLVIGDMDSISDAGRAGVACDRLVHVPEQESTDFEKCLSRITAPLILGLGFLGGRQDHALAALSVLVQTRARCLLIGASDVAFSAGTGIALDLPVGARLSLFPMARVSGRSRGLEWPIDGIAFAPDGAIGTSNRVTGPVTLSFDAPGMLVMVSKDGLAPAIAALRD